MLHDLWEEPFKMDLNFIILEIPPFRSCIGLNGKYNTGIHVVTDIGLNETEWTTYREEHTLALSDDSTTAKESDEEQDRPERYQQVGHIQQLSHLLRRIFNFFY